MTHIDPHSPGYVEPQVAETPALAEIRREVGRENRTAWWVAGLVAVVAIMAVAYMVTRPAAGPTNDEITAAAQQGHAMGVIEGAQSASQDANIAASQAAAAAQSAAAQTAAASQAAADRTAAAASQAAADAQRSADAASDASRDAAERAMQGSTLDAPPAR